MDAKIKDLLTRLSFFAEDGMADKPIVEIAKQADALLLEMARKPNTQQPVAWCELTQSGEIGYFDGKPMIMVGDVGNDCHQTPLYTAPPVPRDVLMAALGELRNEIVSGCKYCAFDGVTTPATMLFEWSDRSNFVCDAHEADALHCAANDGSDTCDNPMVSTIQQFDLAAIADRYASKVQPEPVNQQLLAALKNSLAWIEANTLGGTDALALMADMRAAIAAAEASQPVGEQPRCACGDSFTIDAVCANCLAAKQPASAQPVAVPDELRARCSEILAWHKSGILKGDALQRYASKQWYANEHNSLQMAEADTAREAYAMLSAAQKPEGVPDEMTPAMMRAVQLRTDLGAYTAANLSGAYDLFAEFWRVALEEAKKGGAA